MAERTCVECGNDFEGFVLAKHCSPECETKRRTRITSEWRVANRERVRALDRDRYARKLAASGRQVDALGPRDLTRSKPNASAAWVATPVPCPHCGDEFMPLRASQMYCTTRCTERAAVARWRKRNPDLAAARRDARRRGAPFDEQALAYRGFVAKDPCVYCGSPSSSVDHIVPVIHGGLSREDNLAPACSSCNSRKGAKSLLMFLLYIQDRSLKEPATGSKGIAA